MALGMSFYTLKAQLKFSKINSVKTLDSIYFNAIFQDILIYKIPAAQKKIFVDHDGKIQDDQELIDLLNEIRNKSIYFKYADRSFYDKLVDKLQELENYIIYRTNYTVNRNAFLGDLQAKIENIYDILIEQYKKL